MSLTPQELESLRQCHGFKKLQESLQQRLRAKERLLTRMDPVAENFVLEYTRTKAAVDELCAVLLACRSGSEPE